MKIFFVLFFGLVLPLASFGQSRTIKNMTDAEQLGSMAGVALACNAGNKLDDFELIASYLIGGQAATDAERKEAFKAYASEKLRTYNIQKKETPASCEEVLEHFYALPIFGATVYKDGTIKMPDGKIIKPKTEAPSPAPAKNIMKKAR